MVGVSAAGLAQTHKLLSLADHLSKQSHFNSEECKYLVIVHQRMTSANGLLDRLRFRDILRVTFSITDDVMLDLTFRAFDRDGDSYVDEGEWIRGLSVMMRGNLEQLVEFVYFVYDMNGDRSLAREELHHCLKGCILSGYGVDTDEIDECERDLVEIAMKKLDVDRDGQITFTDFQNAVQTDPLLLQACGPCLPSAKSMATFLALITEKYRSYTGCWAISWSSPTPTRKRSRIFRFGGSNQGNPNNKPVARVSSGPGQTALAAAPVAPVAPVPQ